MQIHALQTGRVRVKRAQITSVSFTVPIEAVDRTAQTCSCPGS
jgi:hypothetical protein